MKDQVQIIISNGLNMFYQNNIKSMIQGINYTDFANGYSKLYGEEIRPIILNGLVNPEILIDQYIFKREWL